MTETETERIEPPCPWCLEPAVDDGHGRRCTALDLQLRVMASGPPADPPLSTMAEHWLWDRGKHEPGELPPPF